MAFNRLFWVVEYGRFIVIEKYLYMKELLIIAFLFFSQLGISQSMGMINDPDGYTNVRNGKGASFEIIARIKEGERFKYFTSNESDWWKIETISHLTETIQGFIHRTRIQPFVDTIDKCKCIQPWGSTEEKPVMIAPIGKTSVTICGYLEETFEDNSIKISEFSVGDCSIDKMMAFFMATTSCKVSQTENMVDILVLERLPVGKGLGWMEVPYKKFVVFNELGYPKITDGEIILDLSAVKIEDIQLFERNLAKYKGKGYFKEIDDIIGKLAVCTMLGSQKSESVFYNLNNYLDFVLDGHFLEFYKDCKKIIEEYKAVN